MFFLNQLLKRHVSQDTTEICSSPSFKRCHGTSSPASGAGPTPLVAMSALHFRWAASLEPQILSELRGMGPSRKPMERLGMPWAGTVKNSMARIFKEAFNVWEDMRG